MTDQMQKFGHRDSPYFRPTQKWQCGRFGACKSGPSLKGKCPLKSNPCAPRLSVKLQKRRIVFLTIGAALTVLLIFLLGKQDLNHLSPGPLSVNHAEVTTCKDCHSAVSESVTDWVSKAIHLNSNNDDAKCLNCHKLGENAILPHSTSPDNFTDDTNRTPFERTSTWDVTLASYLRGLKEEKTDEVSCAVCHQEHQGKFAPIDSFDPQQCHVCHSIKFAKLESGHPQYTQYPHNRPTRIQFDHVTHLKKHFSDEEYAARAPEGCKQCHDTDQSGEWMLSSTFETSCSSCHLEEVLGDRRANAKGVAVLSIPELDTLSLAEAGYYVGQWPEWADGEITPFMELLLPEKLQASAALQNKSLQLYDLSSADAEELRSAAELAWGVKELYYDIQMGGTALMNRRIAEALKVKFNQSTLNRLVASLPKDTLVNNQKEWFPMLMEEISHFRNGEITVFEGQTDEAGVKAENNAPNGALPKDISIERDDTILPDESIAGDEIGGVLIDTGLLDDDFLLDENDGDGASEDDILLGLPSDALLLSDDDLDENEDETSAEPTEQTIQSNRLSRATAPVQDNEDWARTGGWYREGSTIYYRPIDHEDQFLKTWLDVSSPRNDPIGVMLFEYLSDDKAVGKCIKCHSVEETAIAAQSKKPGPQPPGEIGNRRIHWLAFQPDDVGIDFNRFSHASHFGLMNDEGCTSCHKLNRETEASDGAPSASFMNMQRETCTQCHQRGRAPDNCLTCHNYHVEPYTRSIDLISDFFLSTTDSG